MPMTQIAKRKMLHHAFIGVPGLTLRVGTAESVYEGEEAIRFKGQDDLAVNDAEIRFGRTPAERTVTHWYVYSGEDLLAVERVDRPIMLRAGERPFFDAGDLKLELE